MRAGRLEREPAPTLYVPWAQIPDAHSANLVGMLPLSWIVRTRGAPQALGETIDPLVFVAVPLLLAAVALSGVWLPARRAARVEPAAALRLE